MYPICLESGGISSSLRHFGVCQYIHCLSLWVDSYFTGWFWMFVMLHAVVPFFVVSLHLRPLLPQLQLLLLWWLCCLLVCHLFHQLLWPPPWWGFLQYWVRVMWFCWHQGVTTATSICDASSGLCQLCHRFSTGRFLFLSWSLPPFCILYVCVSSGVCFLL